METQSAQGIERLAKTGRTLGILSVAFLAVAFGIWFWVTFISRPTDDGTLLSLGFWILIFLLGGLILGIAGMITSMIALRRNRENENDPILTKIANVGLRLSILSVAIVMILFSLILLFPNRIPPTDPPLPTAIP